MAETIGTVIGIVVVVLIILAPFALITWLVIWLVRRSNRKAATAQTAKSSPDIGQTPAIAPAGFYADPERPGSQRWWDGRHWAPLEVVPEKGSNLGAQQADVSQPLRATATTEGTAESGSIGSADSSSEQRTPRHAAELTAADSKPVSDPSATAALVKNGDRIRDVEWFGSGEPVTVAGYTIPGGLIYVGRKLATPQRSIEPSLINPTLRVDSARPDHEGRRLTYWPAYDKLAAESRAAYLEWLATGRRNPSTPVGYVFLFMYGLERRVLVDMRATAKFHPDLAPIRTEMAALLEIYGQQSYSFQSYAAGFLDVIDMMMSAANDANPVDSDPPRLSSNRWVVPLFLKIALGEFAADQKPLPAAWAVAWAWFNPEFRLRTSATRCTAEFSTLFEKTYADAHGEGMKVTPGSTMLGLTYHAASEGIGYAKLAMQNVPDVFSLAKPTRALVLIAEEVQESLEAFSRYVGKHPDGANSLEGLALLPARLVEESSNPDLESVRTWLSGVVPQTGTVSISGLEILKRWKPAAPASLTRVESTPLIQLLSKLHVGIEPDVRFGGAPLSVDTPVVLFPLADDSPLTPSASYETAATLTHFAAAVSAADGHVSDDEVQAFLPSIESTLQLSDPEKTRLAAHFQWLTASPTKLTGLTKRVALLTDLQRVDLGGLLVSVAAADGNITASEMTALTKIFGLLGLDQSDIASRAFAAQASPTPAAREPITVRVASEGAPGIPIPPRPQSTATPGTIVLDNETIERTMKESASVSELLRGIFDDDQLDSAAAAAPTASVLPEAPADTAEMPSESTEPGISGLDTAHSTIVRLLAGRDTVSHVEFEELARAHNVMPNGAIDTINEAAFDASEEPLLEGDDILTINPHALQEMLK